MTPNQGLRKIAALVVTLALALGLTSLPGLAASQFEGTWKTAGSGGKPMEITLSADGTATGDHSGQTMNGTWKEEGDVAVITWSTGWTTKITKEGDHYKKTAYNKSGEPKGQSDAEKIK